MSARGAGEVVHHDALLARQARGRREIVVGAGAGRDQNEIGGDALAGCERDPGRAGFAVDRRKPRAEPDIDAARAVQRVEEGRISSSPATRFITRPSASITMASRPSWRMTAATSSPM